MSTVSCGRCQAMTLEGKRCRNYAQCHVGNIRKCHVHATTINKKSSKKKTLNKKTSKTKLPTRKTSKKPKKKTSNKKLTSKKPSESKKTSSIHKTKPSNGLAWVEREDYSKVDGERVCEGYWNDDRNTYPTLSMPVAHKTKWPGQDDFIKKLDSMELSARLCTGWKDGKRNCPPGTRIMEVRTHGDSVCRFGDEKTNGNGEYVTVKESICWPAGYLHYIEVHNVRPNRKFYEFVINYKL